MKSTVKVKLRPAGARPNEGVLVFYVTHRRQTRSLTTRHRLKPDEWNDEEQRIVIPENTTDTRRKELAGIDRKMRKEIKDLYKEINYLDQRGEFTAQQLLSNYKERDAYKGICAFTNRKIESLLMQEKFGTARSYENALRSFMKFRDGQDLNLNQLDTLTICKFEQYLKQNRKSMNTISCYMRSLRATYNAAIRERIIERKPEDPFTDVFTGNALTHKRAIRKESIQKINALQFSDKKKYLDLTKDLFLFSFFAQGMAYVDVISLTKDNLKEGYIFYKRQKTGQPLSIKLLPCMQDILNKYSTVTAHSPYLFPVLHSETDEAALWKQYQAGLSRHNRHLKYISSLAGLSTKLTTYVARHSWASIASAEGIPLSIISRGMGHESEKTTRIYIARLNPAEVNKANRKILSFIEKGKNKK
jgi:site-specific recombinase XerD